MTDDKHEILLRLPKHIHNILVRYKKKTGIAVTNQIYGAIIKDLFLKKLINLEDVKEEEFNSNP